ncbi:hypothetical protein PMAYCL1PPCAC_26164, partial [Pristionchus mayeri]
SGIAGTALNSAVIFILWNRKYPTNLFAYRICMTITSVQWLIMSSLVVTLSNKMLNVLLGRFIKHRLHEKKHTIQTFGHFLIYLGLFCVFTTWQMVPGACLLQYFTLCRPFFSLTKRLLFSYGVCAVMMAWSI